MFLSLCTDPKSAASSSTTTTATGATSRSGDPRASVALVGAVCGVGGDRGKGKGETRGGSISEPVYQVLGYALKEGHQVHNWKRRFFVVHSMVWESNYSLVRYYRDSKVCVVTGNCVACTRTQGWACTSGLDSVPHPLKHPLGRNFSFASTATLSLVVCPLCASPGTLCCG